MDISTNNKLKIFLSYADEDISIVNILYNQLVSAGYMPWSDKNNLELGQIRKQEIEKAIRSSDAVIVCLSSASLIKEGEIHYQLRIAQDVQDYQPEGSIFLIPLLLDKVKITELPRKLQDITWGDYTESNSFEKLVSALNKRAKQIGRTDSLFKSPKNANGLENIPQIQRIIEQLRQSTPADHFFEFGDNPQIVRQIETKVMEIQKQLGRFSDIYTSQPSLKQRNLYYDVINALENLQKFVREVQSKTRHSIDDTENLKELISQLEQAFWRLTGEGKPVGLPEDSENTHTVITNATDKQIKHGSRKKATIDVVILTVLGDEYNAICNQLENLQRWPGRTNAINLYAWQTGTIFSKNYNHAYTVSVGMTARAGNTQSALAISNALTFWDPSYIFFSGIAGGLIDFQKASKDKNFIPDIHLGDIVIGDIIHGYEYGKIETDFIPRDDWTYPADQGLWTQAVALKTNSIWRTRVKETPPQPYESKVVEGQIASGDKVVDNPTNAFFATVLKRWPKVKAVEMEGAGIGAAINHARDEKKPVGFLMIRGISDMPRTPDSPEDLRVGKGQTRGTEERDKWKRYAADVSAAFTAGLIAEGLPVPPKK